MLIISRILFALSNIEYLQIKKTVLTQIKKDILTKCLPSQITTRERRLKRPRLASPPMLFRSVRVMIRVRRGQDPRVLVQVERSRDVQKFSKLDKEGTKLAEQKMLDEGSIPSATNVTLKYNLHL